MDKRNETALAIEDKVGRGEAKLHAQGRLGAQESSQQGGCGRRTEHEGESERD